MFFEEEMQEQEVCDLFLVSVVFISCWSDISPRSFSRKIADDFKI